LQITTLQTCTLHYTHTQANVLAAGNITATAVDDIPMVTGVTATMLFCPAAGKLMVANAQICPVTGLTIFTLFIQHRPVMSVIMLC